MHVRNLLQVRQAPHHHASAPNMEGRTWDGNRGPMDNSVTDATHIVLMGIKLVGFHPESNHTTSSHSPIVRFLLQHTALSLALPSILNTTMAGFNNASSLPFQSIPSPRVSIVDILLPGFASMSPAIQQLLTGNLNSYTGLLCTCGILLFLGRHAYEHLWELVDKFLSS